MVNSVYKRAFSEVYAFVGALPEELKSKVTKDFYNVIENNRDKDYIIKINPDITKQKFSNEAEIIIGCMYREFWCSSEKKSELYKKDAEVIALNQKKAEKDSKERFKFSGNYVYYDTKKKEGKSSVNEDANVNLVKYEPKWYNKVFLWLKDIFKKNNKSKEKE